MTDETLSNPSDQLPQAPGRPKEGPLSRALHGLNNTLHGMSLRLVLLRNDPETMQKHAATVEALRRGIGVAADEIDRLEALIAELEEEGS